MYKKIERTSTSLYPPFLPPCDVNQPPAPPLTKPVSRTTRAHHQHPATGARLPHPATKHVSPRPALGPVDDDYAGGEEGAANHNLRISILLSWIDSVVSADIPMCRRD